MYQPFAPIPQQSMQTMPHQQQQQQQQQAIQIMPTAPMQQYVSFSSQPYQTQGILLQGSPYATAGQELAAAGVQYVAAPDMHMNTVNQPQPPMYSNSTTSAAPSTPSNAAKSIYVFYTPTADQQQQQTAFIPLNSHPATVGYAPQMGVSKGTYAAQMTAAAAPPGTMRVLTGTPPMMSIQQSDRNWGMPLVIQTPFLGQPFGPQSSTNSTNSPSSIPFDRELRNGRSRGSINNNYSTGSNSKHGTGASGNASPLAEGKTYEEDPVLIDVTKKQLIVNFLPQRLSNEDFRQLFRPYGALIENASHIIYDLRHVKAGYRHNLSISSDTATVTRSKGYGFIYYKDGASTEAAIKELNGKEVMGRRIKVRYADQQRAVEEHDEVGSEIVLSDEISVGAVSL